MVKNRSLLKTAWRRTLHNFPQKLLALVAALGLWFVATGERREVVDRTFKVPLRVVGESGLQRGRRSVVGIPESVTVSLSGPRHVLVDLSEADLDASVNVTSNEEGTFLEPVHVAAPPTTRVVRVTPTTVSGILDTNTSRTKSVQLAATNLPERAIARYELTPRTVQVTGAQRNVNAVATITTAPVSLPRGASAEVPLIALNAQGQPITEVRLDPATVNVQRTDTGDLPIKTLPVELPSPPEKFELVGAEISPPRIRVIGNEAALEKLRSVKVQVPFRAGQYSVSGNLQLPEGVRSLDTVTVTLDVRAKPLDPAAQGATRNRPAAP